MTTRNSHQIIDCVFNTYIGELNRESTRYQDEPRQDVLTDLMTDLRHYCAANQLDFELAIQRSAAHEAAESEKR